MSAQSHRLTQGGRIDRDRPIAFQFDGRTYGGYFGDTLASALTASVIITLVALVVFGGVKGRLTGTGTLRSALQTVVIGGLAAGAAYLLARLLGGN